MNKILELINVSKYYRDGEDLLHVLKDINLVIHQGDRLAIMGASGSGKTTLLNIAAGLDRPSSGTIEFEGEDIYKLKDNKLSILRNQKIGFIFQSFHLLNDLNVRDNVALPLLISGKNIRVAMEEAEKTLTLVNLENKYKSLPHELSGGEKQRVAIARSVVNKPSIVFADEPTGNLDNPNASLITSLLIKLSHELNTTLVVVTHDNEIADKMDKRLTIQNGTFTD